MEVIQHISSGGFGVVESVRMSDGRIGARKTFRPKDPGNDTERVRRRFRREAETQSRLPAEIAVPILALGTHEDPPWFVMDLAQYTLTAQITADRQANTVSVAVVAEILNALEWLHELDYVHRDLKPGNILFHGGRWKLSDFGLVLPLDPSITTITDGTHGGSAFYMAPEQASEFHFVDRRADIYAFGCILHDWTVGKLRIPYAQHSGPGPVGSVISRCTATDANARYSTVAELRADLVVALSTPTALVPTADAQSWVTKVAAGEVRSRHDLIDLLRFVSSEQLSGDDQLAVFRALAPGQVASLQLVDPGVWPRLALWFCEVAATRSFSFDFCDVIVGSLRQIFDQGSVALKVAATLAAAELAASHNRWFVMRHVVRMAGPTLDDSSARRLALELAGSPRARANFRSCVAQISLTESSYHPIVTAAVAIP